MAGALWPIARGAARAAVAPFALPPLVLLALLEGVRTRRRRAAGRPPRLVWGPTPIIALKYWSAAMRERGFESFTCVDGLLPINRREDFDVHREDFLGRSRAWEMIRDFVVFAWALQRADVFLTYLNGGFLRWTALRRAEGALLRLAGKRLVAFPYGSDIAVIGHLGVAEEALLRDYPGLVPAAPRTRARVEWFCRWADLVIANHQYGYLPRADVVWPTQMAVDTDLWSADGADSGADGVDGEVVVVHAPNHRHVKGTQLLLDAVEALRARGLRVRLELLERRPNEEVRAAVQRADIVAEQFLAGFGIFAIEGMSAGRTVLSALGWQPPRIRDSPFMRDCPLVDVDAEGLEAALERLVRDPAARARIGRAGREFVLAHCSYEATARVWEAIVMHVWRGDPLPAELLPGSEQGDGYGRSYPAQRAA